MSVLDLVLLAVAGLGAGVIGSTAGLASLVSYPALLLVGLPPVTANITNSVGLIGSSLGSVGGSGPELRGLGREVLRQVPVAFLGGAAGAVLLLVSPAGSFEAAVPFLVALASLLLLASPRIRAWGRRHEAAQGGLGPVAVALLFASCAYGGYFGAAAGVMILALLLSRTDHALPVANAVKNVLLGVANTTAAVIFALRAPVEWAAVPPLLIGCVAGGWLGPAVVRRVSPDSLRWVIALAGLALAVKLAVDAFG